MQDKEGARKRGWNKRTEGGGGVVGSISSWGSFGAHQNTHGWRLSLEEGAKRGEMSGLEGGGREGGREEGCAFKRV